MARTGQQRLEAIPAAMARDAEFKAKVKDAEGDVLRCADLMAEAIGVQRENRGLEVVSKDGRRFFTMEELVDCYCVDAAREAYLRARGSNAQAKTP